jgi:hypothetical protein
MIPDPQHFFDHHHHSRTYGMLSIFGESSVPVHDDKAHAAVAGTLLGLLHCEALVDEHALAKKSVRKKLGKLICNICDVKEQRN